MTEKIKFENLSGFGAKFTSSPQTAPAALCLNFKAEGDRLTDGFSLSNAFFGEGNKIMQLPDNVRKGRLFASLTAAGEMIMLASGGKIYIADPEDPESGFEDSGITYSGEVCFANVGANGGVNTAIADESGKITFYDGYSFFDISLEYGVVAVKELYGRLVAVTDSAVLISAEGDPSDFSTLSGGYSLDLGNAFHAKSAAAFGNEIVVAGRRGLCRVARSEFGNSFTLRPIFTDGERLLPETVAAGADGVYIFSERGLARYNGADVTFINPETGVYATEGVCGFIFGGEYHACVKAAENAQKRYVLSFGSKCRLADTPLESVAASADGTRYYALSGALGKICMLGGASVFPSASRRFKTAETDFGVQGRKTLSSFSLYSAKDVRLFLTVDGKRRLYRLVGGSGRRTIRPHASGEVFSFEIVADGNGASIGGIQAEIEY
ncbi:MAG: hypothetical protein IJR61_06285 [Clostridia bacterium]|nr:hypothetical protein [Clostridia bacterium]